MDDDDELLQWLRWRVYLARGHMDEAGAIAAPAFKGWREHPERFRKAQERYELAESIYNAGRVGAA